jgi:hypothetical protein
LNTSRPWLLPILRQIEQKARDPNRARIAEIRGGGSSVILRRTKEHQCAVGGTHNPNPPGDENVTVQRTAETGFAITRGGFDADRVARLAD